MENNLLNQNQTIENNSVRPIPVSAEDALSIAKEQNQYQENLESLNKNGTLEEKTINNYIQPTNVEQSTFDKVNKQQVNQVNDLVKVEVVKTNPKIIALMILVLIVIFIIIALEIKKYIM